MTGPHQKHQFQLVHQNPNMELKQALAQLIDAYADAKASKNQILLSYATQELQNFIQQIDLIQAPPARPAIDAGAPAPIDED